MDTAWVGLFQAYGTKTVSESDKDKAAFLPSEEQQAAMATAGVTPVDRGPGPKFFIHVLGDQYRTRVEASFYRSLRGEKRRPEPRMGRELISSWLEVGDQAVIGAVAGHLFIAKRNASSSDEIIAAELRNALSAPEGLIEYGPLRLRAEEGEIVDAEFSVSGASPTYTLTVECADGRKRNRGYAQALEILFRRLASVDAVFDRGHVASAVAYKRTVQDGLDISLQPAPFALPLSLKGVSPEDLRLAIGRSGAAIGKPPKTSGNTTKRIALTFRVDDESVSSASALADFLVAGTIEAQDDEELAVPRPTDIKKTPGLFLGSEEPVTTMSMTTSHCARFARPVDVQP